MKKKMFALLFTTVMAVSLAACGSSEGTKATEAAKGDQKATEKNSDVSADGGSNELTVWCWDPAFNIYAMKEAEKIYQKDHPDFKVKIVEVPWVDMQTKITTATTSNQIDTLPDILLMQDNAFQKNSINYEGLFADLTDKGIDFTKFAPAKVAYSVVDKKNYGVPFDNGTSITALRTDILKEAGYTMADFTDITWDKFIELGKDVLAKTKKPLITSMSGEPDLIMEMLQSTGESLFNEDGSLNIVNNKALPEIMRVYSELVKSGVCVEVNNWDQYVASFTNGTVAGVLNGCWILGTVQTAEDQSGKWEVTNIPKFDKIEGAVNYSNNGGSSWAVTGNSKNIDLAADFLEKTFAGSVDLYETILPKSGALSTYLPAGDSEAYAVPQEFFGGQKIFADITSFASKVPSNFTGVYYYEARDAVGVAMTNIVGGADAASELKNAEDTVKFQMGE